MQVLTMRSALLLLVCLLLAYTCEGQRRRGRPRQGTRQGSGGLPNHLQEAYHNALSNQDEESTQPQPNVRNLGDWRSYTPSRPSPDQVECYVEVETIQRHGGRCTLLGGSTRTYICQSGPHFEFSEECGALMRHRERHSNP